MKPTLWFRAAAVLLLLFAAGHTYGFLTFRPASAEGQAVWTAMHQVKFAAGNSSFNYAEFYVGFGLFISAFQLFAAWLAWVVGSMAGRGSMETRTLAWGLVALQCVSLVLALRYFSAAPAAFSAITIALLLLGTLSSSHRGSTNGHRSRTI